MANSNECYWDWNGTSLETYAHGIEELNEARGGPPPLRGEDVIIPGRVGRLFQPKVPDSRIITLTMWVIGQDADGNIIDLDTWRANMRALTALLYNPSAQGALTKRWRDTSGGPIRSATAQAQYAGGLTYEVSDNRTLMVARTSVDLLLADPYFYGDVGDFSLAPS